MRARTEWGGRARGADCIFRITVVEGGIVVVIVLCVCVCVFVFGDVVPRDLVDRVLLRLLSDNGES